MANATDDIRLELAATASSIWADEMLDGLDVTAARAQFVAARLRAIVAFGDGASPEAHLGAMEAALDRGRAAIDRRHQALFFSRPGLLTERTSNNTLYQFGYLKQAHELCYWQRERTDALNIIRGQDERVDGCIN